MSEYLLPDVGEGLTEADILSWRVQVGDTVEINQVVVEIETAKSVVELPSPYAGQVTALLVAEGATVPVGTPLLSIADASQMHADASQMHGETSQKPEANLVGYGPRQAAVRRRARRADQAPNRTPTSGRALAKPSARLLAKERGLELSAIVGSAADGVVTVGDVDRVSSAASPDRERREAVRGVRKAMATAMTVSAFSAPHVTTWITVDVTATVELVERLKESDEFRGVKLSPLLILARACVEAIRSTPEVNSVWDGGSGEILYKDYVNLGFAAATSRGLVVPNLKDADRLSLVDLGRGIHALAETARQGRTQPVDMAGGTFTITNVGVFGVDGGTPIINPGESAIIALGAIAKRPWVVESAGGDALAIRQVTTLSLSFDHRHIDGATGSRFLFEVASLMADPSRLIDLPPA
ncbi:MAG: dihydrolipoamide acetyltransferase family protein [Nocardioides sp.]